MSGKITWAQLGGRLSHLPAGLRLLLMTFVVIIGLGYLAAVANIFYSHRLADGREGLGLDDVRAVYGGLRTSEAASGGARPSRMLTMIRGAMRQYFDSDEDYAILEKWLSAGADPSALDTGEARKTPRRVMIRNCLRCHATSTKSEIARTSPFGADEFDVDAAMVARFSGAEAVVGFGGAPVSMSDGSSGAKLQPQYDIARLFLVSHQHMLAIPLFTLMIGGLFAMTRLPAGLRAVLTPLPMLATLLDFSGWYLARVWSGGAILVAVMGGVFGVVFGFQVVVLLVDLARPLGDARGD